MSAPRIANAPLSYGAFEYTVGTSFPVPDAARVLAAVSGGGLRRHRPRPARLPRRRQDARASGSAALELAGGFVPVAFSEDWDFSGLHATLDLFDAAGASTARPVLCDAGGPERIANPGAGAALALDDARWRRLVDGVERAAETARERGYEPVFHHHTSTYVEGVPEIERFLADTDVPLLLDSGHLAVAGGDPVGALRDWRDRVGAVHIKDARLDVVAA